MNSAIIKLPNGDFTTSTYVKDHFYYEGHLGPKKAVKIQLPFRLTTNFLLMHMLKINKYSSIL